MKTKLNVFMGAMALILAAVAIIACTKEKTAQQDTTNAQQTADVRNYTFAEMVDALSWEEGKAFFQNRPIKDYTIVCEQLMNDCSFAEKEAGLPYIISWVLRLPNGNCIPTEPGACLAIRKKETSSMQVNANGFFEDGKLILVPTSEDNGFTSDGYLAIGAPIEVQFDSIVIQEGIYTAYYDEEAGRYTAVAVDYYSRQ